MVKFLARNKLLYSQIIGSLKNFWLLHLIKKHIEKVNKDSKTDLKRPFVNLGIWTSALEMKSELELELIL